MHEVHGDESSEVRTSNRRARGILWAVVPVLVLVVASRLWIKNNLNHAVPVQVSQEALSKGDTPEVETFSAPLPVPTVASSEAPSTDNALGIPQVTPTPCPPEPAHFYVSSCGGPQSGDLKPWYDDPKKNHSGVLRENLRYSYPASGIPTHPCVQATPVPPASPLVPGTYYRYGGKLTVHKVSR